MYLFFFLGVHEVIELLYDIHGYTVTYSEYVQQSLQGDIQNMQSKHDAQHSCYFVISSE